MALRRSEERGGAGAGLSRAQTLDLCAHLASYTEAGPTPRDLLLRVGAEAVRGFGEDGEVLVAVGRMYLMGEELTEAELVLRRAVKRAPQDPHGLRHFGEVLLRLGDPTAAHAALSRAVACGMNDPWTKTWVARALDYSELLTDLGRDGIARDVRQVLGKPGVGPQDESGREDRPAAPAGPGGSSLPPSPHASADGRTRHILAKIDTGVFFPGDMRAEPVDSRRLGRWGVRDDDIIDLPTPAPAGVAGPLNDLESPTRVSTVANPWAAALAQDAAWGKGEHDAPDSDSMPGSDTQISTWEPQLETSLETSPRLRPSGARPEAGRPEPSASSSGSVPTAQRAPARLVAQRAAAQPSAQRASTLLSTPPVPSMGGDGGSSPPAGELISIPSSRVPRSTGSGPPESPASAARVAPMPPGLPRLSAAELFDEFTENRRVRGRPATEKAEPQHPRRGPPPLPNEPARPDLAIPPPGLITIAMDDASDMSPVTAPPSALIPIDSMSHPGTATAAAAETAPVSALFPPEPPSLQVPSKLLLGGGFETPKRNLPDHPEPKAGRSAAARAPSTAAAPALAAAPKATTKLTPAPKQKRKLSRLQSVLARVVVALAIAGLLVGGYGLYKRNRGTKIRMFTAQANAAMHVGGPRGIADAEAALASARGIEPKNRTVALATLRARSYAVLDVDPARRDDLSASLTDAITLGVARSDTAFAELARAVATNDTASATELIAHHDQDPERAGDALYQLAAGAALEGHDAPAAVERYRAALKLDPEMLSAEIRLARALAFGGYGAEAAGRLSALSQKWPSEPAIGALGALIAAADPKSGAPSGRQALVQDVDMLPRPLRAVARALAKGSEVGALDKAVSESDIAPVAVLCGEIALGNRNEAVAREAAHRALEITSSYAPAHALVARVGLASGRSEEARQAALRAPPEVTSEVLAFLAYEAGDLAAMAAAAGHRASEPLTDAVAAGFQRLRGAAPLPAAARAALAKSPLFWADVVAMDASLDAGDLDLARTIAAGWPDADKHPTQAARIARLLRYEGKNGAAQTASASAVPTLAARIESGLDAAEMASSRTAAGAALEKGRTPEERWAAVFLLARDGKEAPARLLQRSLAYPAPDSPLLTRIVAALALHELRLKNPTLPFYLSLEPWVGNPDVARALGIVRPDPETPGASPAVVPPAKPPVRAPQPAKPDSGDPY